MITRSVAVTMAIMPALNTNHYHYPHQSPFDSDPAVSEDTHVGLDKVRSSNRSHYSEISTKSSAEPLIQVFVSHVGDCRAVLSCNDGVVVQLTEDHKASNKAEKLRIEAAKGGPLSSLS